DIYRTHHYSLSLHDALPIYQRLAFNRYTTTGRPTLAVYVEGHYDNLNNWVEDSWEPPKKFRCTPIAYGDRDSGVAGQQLKATDRSEEHTSELQSRFDLVCRL